MWQILTKLNSKLFKSSFLLQTIRMLAAKVFLHKRLKAKHLKTLALHFQRIHQLPGNIFFCTPITIKCIDFLQFYSTFKRQERETNELSVKAVGRLRFRKRKHVMMFNIPTASSVSLFNKALFVYYYFSKGRPKN